MRAFRVSQVEGMHEPAHDPGGTRKEGIIHKVGMVVQENEYNDDVAAS